MEKSIKGLRWLPHSEGDGDVDEDGLKKNRLVDGVVIGNLLSCMLY